MTNVLIVGGSSGLGLELAKLYTQNDMNVHVMGRKDPCEDKLSFEHLDLSGSSQLSYKVYAAVNKMPPIDLLVYAAGFYQEGRLSDLAATEIDEMFNVGLRAPTFFLQEILRKQKTLQGFIAVTSTSQWTPRLLEPVYTAAKGGLARLARSVSQPDDQGNRQIRRTLVAGPAAMATRFWEKDGRDMSVMLDPAWVAEQIIAEYNRGESYREVKILRNPSRVELRVSEP